MFGKKKKEEKAGHVAGKFATGYLEIQLDEAYEQGYWDTLNCVKRKGGSARAAADNCEDE